MKLKMMQLFTLFSDYIKRGIKLNDDVFHSESGVWYLGTIGLVQKDGEDYLLNMAYPKFMDEEIKFSESK